MKRLFVAPAALVLAMQSTMAMAHATPECRPSGGITVTASERAGAVPTLGVGQRLIVLGNTVEDQWTIFEYDVDRAGKPDYQTLCGGARDEGKEFATRTVQALDGLPGETVDVISCGYTEVDGRSYLLHYTQLSTLGNDIGQVSACMNRMVAFLDNLPRSARLRVASEGCKLPEGGGWHCVYAWKILPALQGIIEGSGGGSGGGNGH